MKRQRLTPEAKVSILREHLENHISVADICEKYRIHPNQLYQWKKAFFENAVELFAQKKSRNHLDKDRAHFEARLRERNEIIAELLQENLKLKKLSGEI